LLGEREEKMLLRTGIHYGYMEKGKFHEKPDGDTCEVVSIFEDGSIKGYCGTSDLSIKNEIQKQVDIHDNLPQGRYHHSNY
jgi:hypothetical protein